MTVLESILKLTEHLSVENISARPDAWQQRIDDRWYVAINGTGSDAEVTPDGGGMASTIPPYHFAVWYNGWLAGLFSANGGAFAAGIAANEATFAEAVERFMERE